MKGFTLVAVAATMILSGCASTNPDGKSQMDDDNYVATGTYIPRKNATRADVPTIPDKQSMENDRTMGSANQDGLQR